jgi:hypothetical protein
LLKLIQIHPRILGWSKRSSLYLYKIYFELFQW